MLLQIGCSIVRREGERAAWCRPRRPLGWTLLLQHPHDVALLHDEELLPVDLHLGARPLAEQDLVALLYVERDELPGLVAGARAGSDDLALLGLLRSGIRDNDAAGRLGLGLHAADGHAVVQGSELHEIKLSAFQRVSGLDGRL